MKKIITICLFVLFISSVVLGALSPMANLQSDRDVYMSGETAKISLQANFDVTGFSIREIRDTADPMGIANIASVSDKFSINVQDGSDALVNDDNILFYYDGGSAIGGAMVPGSEPVVSSNDIFTFDYIVPEYVGYITLYTVGDVSVSGSSGEYLTEIGSVLFYVPEPLTILILGLGGVFLCKLSK